MGWRPSLFMIGYDLFGVAMIRTAALPTLIRPPQALHDQSPFRYGLLDRLQGIGDAQHSIL